MQRYSVFALVREAMRFHRGWQRAWRDPAPKPRYQVVVVGGGGHGLATAYYLAKRYGIRDIAVVEKGWIGGGNTGRNTTIIRSNYLQDASAAIYETSLQLYEGLSQALNYNIMFSPRGLVMLAQTRHEVSAFHRTVAANRLQGIDTEWLNPAQVQAMLPMINIAGPRYPVLGALHQPRGGTARHDAVAWGYARAASDLGVDILQNCEVTGIDGTAGRVTGIRTTRGAIGCDKLALVTAGHSSRLAEMAGFRLPLETVALQALVSEPVKPCLDHVVMANTVHGYISQSDKGELVIGGGSDGFNSYAQRGSFQHVEETLRALVETFPPLTRMRMMRQWAGLVDMTGDRSPILSQTPLAGCFVNCGWGTGGFKAIPGSGYAMAELVARGEPGPLAAPFSMHRFREGRFIDESVAAGVAH